MEPREIIRSMQVKYHVRSLAALAARIDEGRGRPRYDGNQMLSDYIAWERVERTIKGKGGNSVSGC